MPSTNKITAPTKMFTVQVHCGALIVAVEIAAHDRRDAKRRARRIAITQLGTDAITCPRATRTASIH